MACWLKNGMPVCLPSVLHGTWGHNLFAHYVPGLNFINVLRTAFMLVGPKSVRIQSRSQYLFTLLGSTCADTAHRTLMKLTPGRVVGQRNPNFIVEIGTHAGNSGG